MQELKADDTTLLIGDAVADLLLRYAALLSGAGRGDTVRLTALREDGSALQATLLLNAGTFLMTESSTASWPEPDNREAEESLRSKLSLWSLDGFQPFGLENDE